MKRVPVFTFGLRLRNTVFLIALLGIGQAGIDKVYAQEKELNVLDEWIVYNNNATVTYRHLVELAVEMLDVRRNTINGLKTESDWRKRQEEVRSKLTAVVGAFPDRTPLNARVTGVVQKRGYRVEKIIFESLPGFYVTSALFVPDGLEGKAPAILFCSGHAAAGFRSEAYQTMIINLVQKGFIVFAFDPVGQGERLQYFDVSTGQSRVGGPTKEHSYPGAQVFLTGQTLARYMIWDGIRAVDYLLTREEVDPDRIGITGRSGGGTQSAYIAAFDDRILAAAPEAYITSFERLFQTRGPQDAEQNFFRGIASGLDHADLLEVRAPKPALMITTTRDIFSMQGARETFAEVKQAYQAFGAPDLIRMVEDDAEHASTQKNREAMYAFFQEMLDLPGNSNDENIELLSDEELRVTSTGQVSTSLEGETIYTLNRKEADRRLEELDRKREDLEHHLPEVIQAAKQLTGYLHPESTAETVFAGRYPRDGYAVEQYYTAGEGDYVIPFLLLIPDAAGPHPVMVYLNPDGKAADASVGGKMEQIVRDGYMVLAPDLPGSGELSGSLKGDSQFGTASYNEWFGGILTGRSLVGIQAGDLVRVIDYVADRPDVNPERIDAMAQGVLGPVLLHAAAFHDRIRNVTLIDVPISYASFVTHENYDSRFIPASVAGALTSYDLPDLAAALAPRKLLLVNPVDQAGKPAAPAEVDREYAVTRTSYDTGSTAQRFKVIRSETGETNWNEVLQWMK